MTVGIWLGCHTRDLLENLKQIYLDLLNELGFEYKIVDYSNVCCGYPADLMGADEAALEASKKALKLALDAKVEKVVTPCPGCYRHLSVNWGQEMPIEHLTQFLAGNVEKLRNKLKPLNARIAYHDPCDLGRHCGIYEEPRRILEAIQGIELVELEKNREKCTCCGGGGLLFAVEPELSLRIAMRKFEEEIKPLKIDYLATACPTCYRILSYAVERTEFKGEVVDIAELLYKSLKS